MNLSTPELALQSLEEAYRQKDLVAALACRNFHHEARLMLHHMKQEQSGSEFLDEPEIIQKTAEVLELALKGEDLPDFSGITTKVLLVEHYWDCIHIATESVTYPNGVSVSQRMLVANEGEKWFVLCPASLYEQKKVAKKPWWKFW